MSLGGPGGGPDGGFSGILGAPGPAPAPAPGLGPGPAPGPGATPTSVFEPGPEPDPLPWLAGPPGPPGPGGTPTCVSPLGAPPLPNWLGRTMSLIGRPCFTHCRSLTWIIPPFIRKATGASGGSPSSKFHCPVSLSASIHWTVCQASDALWRTMCESDLWSSTTACGVTSATGPAFRVLTAPGGAPPVWPPAAPTPMPGTVVPPRGAGGLGDPPVPGRVAAPGAPAARAGRGGAVPSTFAVAVREPGVSAAAAAPGRSGVGIVSRGAAGSVTAGPGSGAPPPPPPPAPPPGTPAPSAGAAGLAGHHGRVQRRAKGHSRLGRLPRVNARQHPDQPAGDHPDQTARTLTGDALDHGEGVLVPSPLALQSPRPPGPFVVVTAVDRPMDDDAVVVRHLLDPGRTLVEAELGRHPLPPLGSRLRVVGTPGRDRCEEAVDLMPFLEGRGFRLIHDAPTHEAPGRKELIQVLGLGEQVRDVSRVALRECVDHPDPGIGGRGRHVALRAAAADGGPQAARDGDRFRIALLEVAARSRRSRRFPLGGECANGRYAPERAPSHGRRYRSISREPLQRQHVDNARGASGDGGRANAI